jgi:cobalt-precorrin-5B (C1)-methyltransferase
VTRKKYDLQVLADNGLRRGITTGSCATAGVKAALLLLEKDELHDSVKVSLPDSEYFLDVEVKSVERVNPDCAVARVVKYAGDDPDNTDGAVIVAEIRRNGQGVNTLAAGPGVGTVTQPGIRVPVGEPAINPVPRKMISKAVEEVLDGKANAGFDVIIGCENGERIAKRTFNERLGIIGGISILGTSGIVEPMSLAAYQASIEVYIRVALGVDASRVAFMPGNIGLSYAKRTLLLPPQQIVVIANFLGFSVNFTEAYLKEQGRVLDNLWILGHPGKLAKILDGVWDTHSSKSDMAMGAIARVAQDLGAGASMARGIMECKTVEGVIVFLNEHPIGKEVWKTVEDRCSAIIQEQVDRAGRVVLRLFSMNGTPIGHAIDEV